MALLAETMADNKSRGCQKQIWSAASLGVNGKLLLVSVTRQLSHGVYFPVQQKSCIFLIPKWKKNKISPWIFKGLICNDHMVCYLFLMVVVVVVVFAK